MKKLAINFIYAFCIASIALQTTTAAPIVRTAAGANPAAIQAMVDQFRTDLGGPNNGVGGSFKTGRREINWDGVPDASAAPNFLAPDFFNVTSPRGVVMNTLEIVTGGGLNDFIVSADSNNPTATPIEFGHLDASYPATFQSFSGERIFTARNTNVMEVNFFIPGTSIPATVKGFGVVFSDVDTTSPSSGKAALIRCYSSTNAQLVSFTVEAANNGLSFGGAFMNAATDARIARCMIQTGNVALASGNPDGATNDVIAMDDFIYGEPRAAEWHSSDFDGDGFSDPSVFRPATGEWFTLNSGSNTVSANQWGQNGDLPLDGDFDGDKLADLAIFRPSDGTWWILRSQNGQVVAHQFGQNGDKPTVGDFDKDGKTDIAFWRPGNGHYFVLRSSNNSFFSFPWGTNGDIPLQGAAQ